MDPTIAADVIAFNQQANSNPRKGTIMRWQPPMPVFIDSSMGSRRTCVIRALDIWQGATGIPYVLLDSDIAPAPRVKVYATYLPDNRPRTWIESTNLDNSKRLESVIWGEDWPNRCDPSAYWFTTYVHELGHALGVHGHIPNETTCVMSYERDHSLGPQPCEREIRLLTELYKLPLGAHVEPDGTWVR